MTWDTKLDVLHANIEHIWNWLQWYMVLSLVLQAITLWRAW